MSPTDATLRDWLLHRLPEADAVALEERLLREDAFATRLLEVETDLIDDHAAGLLDAATREAVARHLIADPAGRWRWTVARALAARTRTATLTRQRRRRRLAAAIGALAAAAVLAIALMQPDRAPQAPADIAALPTISLRLAATRGEATPLRLPANDGWLRLQVEVAESAAAAYELTVRDGTDVRFHASGLALHRAGPYGYVEAVIPAAAAGPGRRQVELAPTGAAQAPAIWYLETTAP
ncbi:MAG: hypothetical protein DI564_09250 [Rhodanobacter denitrificans]|uniref:Anti-sigma factor n=1 Tax=Rhodanobacter denitrificans TaxID=666685 RepID=A0A2W5MPH1_9GAMM|nr:MAG: hypothetical protein DI564_09250 [Rhodanobacter denitrificans]